MTPVAIRHDGLIKYRSSPMRIYAQAHAKDLRTVKLQGEKIASAWHEQRGLSVNVKAIKRIGFVRKDVQWGFVVLESLFSSYLCHYRFDGSRLEVTGEASLSGINRDYLQCPGKLLALAPSENDQWRDLNRTYLAATKELTKERLAGNVQVFIKRAYETREYGEPFFVLQKRDGQWFGIDCYDEERPLTIGNSDVHDHCPVLIDKQTLRKLDASSLASDCVNAGGVIYKQCGDHATVLGRAMSSAEIADERLSHVIQPVLALEGNFAWS